MVSVYDLNAIVNIVMAGLVLHSSVLVYRCGLLPKWLFAMFWICCLGWIALYAVVLLNNPLNLDSVTLGRIFIRPLITLTLGTIASTFIDRYRKCRPNC